MNMISAQLVTGRYSFFAGRKKKAMNIFAWLPVRMFLTGSSSNVFGWIPVI
jgi:hypothetical protein